MKWNWQSWNEVCRVTINKRVAPLWTTHFTGLSGDSCASKNQELISLPHPVDNLLPTIWGVVFWFPKVTFYLCLPFQIHPNYSFSCEEGLEEWLHSEKGIFWKGNCTVTWFCSKSTSQRQNISKWPDSLTEKLLCAWLMPFTNWRHMLPIACCWSRSKGMLTLLQLLRDSQEERKTPPWLGLPPGGVLAPSLHSQIFVPSLGLRNPYCYGRIAAERYIYPQISKQQNISTIFIHLFHKHLLRAYYVSGYF